MNGLLFHPGRVLLAALLLTLPSAHAAETPSDAPLPDGAVARLGSANFYDKHAHGAAAVSPDSRLLATSSLGNWRIILWDLATGQWRCRIAGGGREMAALAFSPQSDRFVATDGEKLIVYDASDGERISEATANRGKVTALAWTPDGKRFLSAGPTAIVEVWDARTGERIARLSKRADCIAMLPDGTRVALLSVRPGRLWVWDMVDEHAAREADCRDCHPALAVLPDGKRVGVLTQQGIAIYHAKSALPLASVNFMPIYPRVGSLDSVTALRFLDDGRQVVMATEDRLWAFRVDGYERLAEGVDARLLMPDRLPNDIGSPYELRQAVLSPDGTLAAARRRESWTVIDVKAARKRPAARDGLPSLQALDLSRDGRRLLTADRGSAPSKLRVRDVATRRPLCLLDPIKAAAQSVRAPDPPLIWARSGSEGRFKVVCPRAIRYPQHRLSPDGEFVVGIKDRNGPACVWRVKDGRFLHGLPVSAAMDFDFADGGRSVAVINESAEYSVWDLTTGVRKHHTTASNAAPFDPDWLICIGGETIAERGESGDVTFRTALDDKTLWTLPGHFSLETMSPDRSRLLVRGPGNMLAVCDARTGEVRGELRTRELLRPQLLALNHAASRLALVDVVKKDRVRIWDLAAAGEIGQCDGHMGAVDFCAFTPDDKLLITGAEDGTVLFWDLQRLRKPKETR